MSVLSDLRAKRNAINAQLQGIVAAVEKRGDQLLTAAETEQSTQLRSQRDLLEERIEQLEAAETRDAAAAKLRVTLGDTGPSYDRVARVGLEARTYNPHAAEGLDGKTPLSFLSDGYRASVLNDYEAQDRMRRHMQEVRVEQEARATSTGSFAGLVVPQYLVEEVALVVRQGRPTANACRTMTLPEQGMSFLIPRGTTGATVASQSPENSIVSSTDEVFANLSVNVVTLAGMEDVSRQSLERGTPGIDALIFSDLAGAYAAELDRQVLNGSGASGQALGILQTAGTYSGTAFAAAVNATNFYSHIAGAQQQILSTRYAMATAIIMSPRRWAWLLAQVDSSGRPLVVPAANGAYNAQGSVKQAAEYGQIMGQLQGLPILVDANVPTNVGANSEDAVIVARMDDQILWEDGPAPRELRFEQTLGGQLTVRLVAYGYVAFTAARYPQAVAHFGGADTVAGNGLIAPTLG